MKKICSFIILFLTGLNLYANGTIQNDSVLKIEPVIVEKQLSDSIALDSALLVSNISVPAIGFDCYRFENDSVFFDEPKNIGQIVYVEHTKDIDKILEYLFPIFMLLLGVVIDRCLLKINEKERIKRNGELWLIEINALKGSLEKQRIKFYYGKFKNSYC